MSQTLFWLTLSLILTAVLWIPYILNALVVQGVGAMGYQEGLPMLRPWAQRAKKAHYNAVENLVLLAPATLAYVLLMGQNTGETLICALQIYFFSRLIHYVSYMVAVPYVRTLSFSSGWFATLYILIKVYQVAA
ncbi:MAG: MAPEG family protein [Bdellovibrionota bacterium]